MKSKAKVVVVGGGVVGVSMLYHLAKKGWSDVVCIERKELTSGSTWHAAGLLPLFNMSYSVGQLHKYAVDFYKTLEKETGKNVGFSVVSNIRLASTKDRMDEYHQYAGVAQTIGVDVKFLSPKQVKEIWPLCNVEDLVGAIQHPEDGYIQPADLTQALATGARNRGAEIYRNTVVIGIKQTKNGWVVETDKGTIECEHVVSCTGNFARQTGKMVGLDIPAIPVEHQYIVTEPDPALVEWRKNNPEHPVLRDADAKWYVREERGGWILGPYEKGAPARFKYNVPDTFRADLFPLDLDRIETEYLSMIHRLPSSEEVGLKADFNGPICYTPDGNPLVGPVQGLRNMWLAEGFSFGITAAGGVGYYLSQLMDQGEAEIDMASLDPRRFGNWITTDYAARKNEESYEHVFILHHPDEEREACRPLKTAPSYERQKTRGAQFGQVNGWERPNYFATVGFDDLTSRSFRRGAWWNFVKEEAISVRKTAGLIDATAFTKHVIKGPGATAFLDWFTCNKLPKVGRINLTYALTEKGTTRTEYTIVRVKHDEYYLVSAGAWQAYDADFLIKAIQDKEMEFGRIELQDVTSQFGVFAIAGPNSRAILSDLVRHPEQETVFSNKNFPWLSAKSIELGMCPVNAIRVAYTGELGWELHHPIEMQNYLFDQLEKSGQKYGMKLVGARAQNWLRQEKSYRAFGTELGRDATPLEAGLDRFVDLSKDFFGKDQMIKHGIRSKCVTLLIDGPKDADPWGREALYIDKKRAGRLTSGGYSVEFNKSIGMGYITPEFANVGQALKVKMFDELWNAVVVEDSPYDSKNINIRIDSK